MSNLIYPAVVLIIGFALTRLVPRIGGRSLAAVCLFVFLPALFFKQAIGQNYLLQEFSYILFFFLFHTVCLFLLSKTALSLIQFPVETKGIGLLNAMIPNMFGLWLIQAGISSNNMQSLLFINIIIFYQFALIATLGVYLAAYSKHLYFRVLTIAKTPLVFALLAGLVIGLFQIKMPAAITAVLDNLYVASNPLALLLVGIAIGNHIYIFDSKSYSSFLPGVFLCAFLRLIVSPALACAIVWMMGIIDGGSPRAVVLASSLPTGIYACVLAEFYGKEDQRTFTLLCFLTTSLLSFITVPTMAMLIKTFLPLQ